MLNENMPSDGKGVHARDVYGSFLSPTESLQTILERPPFLAAKVFLQFSGEQSL